MQNSEALDNTFSQNTTVTFSQIIGEKYLIQKKIENVNEELTNPMNQIDFLSDKEDKEYLENYKNYLSNLTVKDIENIILWKNNNNKNREQTLKEGKIISEEKANNRNKAFEGELFSFNELNPIVYFENKKTNKKTSIQIYNSLENNLRDFAKLKSLKETKDLIKKIKESGFNIQSNPSNIVLYNSDKYYHFKLAPNPFESRDLNEWDFIKYLKNGLKITKRMKDFENIENKKDKGEEIMNYNQYGCYKDTKPLDKDDIVPIAGNNTYILVNVTDLYDKENLEKKAGEHGAFLAYPTEDGILIGIANSNDQHFSPVYKDYSVKDITKNVGELQRQKNYKTHSESFFKELGYNIDFYINKLHLGYKENENTILKSFNYHNQLEIHIKETDDKIKLIEPSYNNDFLELDKYNQNGKVKNTKEISEELDNLALKKESCLYDNNYIPAIAEDTINKDLKLKNTNINKKFSAIVEQIKKFAENNKKKICGAMLGLAVLSGGMSTKLYANPNSNTKQILFNAIESENNSPLFKENTYNMVSECYKKLGYENNQIPSYEQLRTESVAYSINKDNEIDYNEKNKCINLLESVTKNYSIKDYNSHINDYIIENITNNIHDSIYNNPYMKNEYKGYKNIFIGENKDSMLSFEQYSAYKYINTINSSDFLTDNVFSQKMKNEITEKTCDIFGIDKNGNKISSQNDINMYTADKYINAQIKVFENNEISDFTSNKNEKITVAQAAAVKALNSVDSISFLTKESKKDMKDYIKRAYNIDENNNIINKKAQKEIIELDEINREFKQLKAQKTFLENSNKQFIESAQNCQNNKLLQIENEISKELSKEEKNKILQTAEKKAASVKDKIVDKVKTVHNKR